MDFLTQNLVGAVAGHAALGRRRSEDGPPTGLGRLALLAGALGGAVPDFDVLLRRWADPALPFELHRHFTHALVFIPLGGLLATLPLLLIPRCRRHAGLTFAAATVGCATHGLLDNLTSYGTHLYWPFIPGRTSWDAMSIIDPLFTGLLALGIIVALVRGRVRATRVAFALGLVYIGFGFVQHERAMSAQRTLAAARGHEVVHGRAMPTLANLFVFRSLYVADGEIWADAIRVPLFAPSEAREGSSMPRYTEADLPATATARTRAVFHGWETFADGFLAAQPAPWPGAGRLVIADMRISVDTDGFVPLWGMLLDEEGRNTAAWEGFDTTSGRAEGVLDEMIADLFEPAGRFRTLGAE